MDATYCKLLKLKLETCLNINIEVFGRERGDIMCMEIQKVYKNQCKL